MDFFKRLYELAEGQKLTLTVMGKNGKLTVGVLPDGIAKIQPLNVTGTPEELDAQFLDMIKAPLTEARIVSNTEEFTESLKDATAKPKPTVAAEATKKAAEKKVEPTKPKPKTPVAAKKGPEQMSLMDEIEEGTTEESEGEEQEDAEGEDLDTKTDEEEDAELTDEE